MTVDKWVVKDEPPAWLLSIADAECWPEGTVQRWRVKLELLHVAEVHLTRFQTRDAVDLDGDGWTVIYPDSGGLDGALVDAVGTLEAKKRRFEEEEEEKKRRR